MSALPVIGSETRRAAKREGLLQEALDTLRQDERWGRTAADFLIDEALRRAFSDLHISPTDDGVTIRGRREGALVPLATVATPERAAMLIARLKVMARVPSYVRHEPQDGRIDIEQPNGELTALRASFLPTVQGESVVLRFPAQSVMHSHLGSLGMAPEVLAGVERALGAREGCLFVTGPSGSGKTTTLYAMMARLDEALSDRLQMIAIEDPVERKLPFVRQIQVSDSHGVTFESALRAALRHDPDVLLVGEVRDLATARTAVQAGTSGHLVLTTLHAGRALRVVPRLVSMGVEAYLAAAAVNAVVAQRLVRVRCDACASGPTPTCEICGGTGIAGRRGLFEVLVPDESLRELILSRPGSTQFEQSGARCLTGDIEREAHNLAQEGVIAPLDADLLTSDRTATNGSEDLDR